MPTLFTSAAPVDCASVALALEAVLDPVAEAVPFEAVPEVAELAALDVELEVVSSSLTSSV